MKFRMVLYITVFDILITYDRQQIHKYICAYKIEHEKEKVRNNGVPAIDIKRSHFYAVWITDSIVME
jgi:hypothetical protein